MEIAWPSLSEDGQKFAILAWRRYLASAVPNVVGDAVGEWNNTLVSRVISGGAQGVDRAGEEWALASRVPVTVYPADWRRHGKSAGIMRNIEMAKDAHALIAIWDGRTNGTRHMIATMRELGKPVHVMMFDWEVRIGQAEVQTR